MILNLDNNVSESLAFNLVNFDTVFVANAGYHDTNLLKKSRVELDTF